MASPPPLTGIRVVELAGLAPGPFAGLLLADYGASVLRIDRPHPQAHSTSPSTETPPPTSDNLTRHKSSIALSLKFPSGLTLLKSLISTTDILIDPFRPGVLEKLGLSPQEVLLKLNPRLIVARMTGFRRDGKYKDMAGHDINYLAVSGVLSMLGREGDRPHAPGNILGDFAGGGAVLFAGILMALLERHRSGKGQVVEANMVDGVAYLATFPRLAMKTPAWDGPRGENQLDGGAPYYDTYETGDGKFVSVGALEPQFWAELLRGLGFTGREVEGDRLHKGAWARWRELFEGRFRSRTRREWEEVFDGTDACVAPVLEQGELERGGFGQRPYVTLRDTAGFAVSGSKSSGQRQAAEGQGEGVEGEGVEGEGWKATGLSPGVGGEETLKKWMGWRRGVDYEVEEGGLVAREKSRL
ncbi:MAG: hypothetical protein M1828_000450 [Chrysothrix sp. TS-e1954]|nr:MAG: hypothetical protein M1828_000450 [Chrysothrix sp. TS-e1954]